MLTHLSADEFLLSRLVTGSNGVTEIQTLHFIQLHDTEEES